MTYLLAIGDRAYSSWSLRAWLAFAKFGLPVHVELGRLYSPDLLKMLARFGAARTVPALRVTDEGEASFVVWDSLAIAEALAERHPHAGFWPDDPAARGLARSLVAEMHSGFAALRSECPMNLRRAYVGFEPTAAIRADLVRMEALWHSARAVAAEGPWLFGSYSLADAFFAPAATRLATYDLPVGPEANAYMATHLADPAFLDWRAEGLADPYVQQTYDLDLPERPWPGPLG